MLRCPHHMDAPKGSGDGGGQGISTLSGFWVRLQTNAEAVEGLAAKRHAASSSRNVALLAANTVESALHQHRHHAAPPVGVCGDVGQGQRSGANSGRRWPLMVSSRDLSPDMGTPEAQPS